MTEVYICDYVRTPIGRYGGALSAVRADDLAALPLAALLTRNAALDPAAIDEVYMGCANQAGEDNRNVARMCALLAGLPETVPATTLNRLCGSGMDAILSAARAIKAGDIALAIAGGVENMSRAPFVMPKASSAFSRTTEVFDTTIGWRFVNPLMHQRFGTDSMPETAENIAQEFHISRDDQDDFALRSQQKAQAAQISGRFAQEIVPVTVSHRKGDIVVDTDEHLRPRTVLGDLQKLRPIVQATGTVTAGNASGVNDGAAAMILASESAMETHGLTPIAKVLGGATTGVAPRIMGIGPVSATHRLLDRLGLGLDDVAIIELNEAFASQALACLRQLGIADTDPRVNPNGGAIALGHPLGMSGTRITGSAMLDLRAHQIGLATMCVGVGQGIAIALERV